MRPHFFVLLLLFGSAGLCHAQEQFPVDTGTRSAGFGEPNDDPDIHDFVTVEKEASYNPEDLRRNTRYPEAAREAGIEGSVVVHAIIDKRGRATKIIVDHSDNKLLSVAAVNAVKETPFRPALQNGQPIATWMPITVDFHLADSPPPPPPPKFLPKEESGFADMSQTHVQTDTREGVRSSGEEAVERRFDQEHGRLRFRTTINGTEGTSDYVWDRYGQRVMMKMQLQTPGDSATNFLSITADGYRTSYMETRMGIIGRRSKLGSLPGMDGLPDVQTMMASFTSIFPPGTVRPAAPRTIIGREAKGVELDTLGITLRIWSQGKLVLASEIVLPPVRGGSGLEVTTEAVAVDLDSPVPPDTFNPPAGATIVDNDKEGRDRRRR